MPQVRSNGIILEYEAKGPPDGPPLLLIHGAGAQLIRWPEPLCAAFVAAGFRVIRFDNRDVGLSTHMADAPIPDLEAVLTAKRRREVPVLPYTLSDLALDAVGLLDALAIKGAHVFGVSLGGMIAQVLAIEHPGRILSANIVMSQSGSPDLPSSRPDAIAILAQAPPDPSENFDGFIDHSVRLNRILGSPGYPEDEAALRDLAARAASRAYDPAGVARQIAAGRGSADRRAALRGLRLPTLVVHGRNDPLIPVAAGEDIAANVRGAWLLTIDGMGHDLPSTLSELFASAVRANSARAMDHTAPTS